MIRFKFFINAICLAFVVAAAMPANAQDLAKKATAFLNSLSPELKSKTQFTLGDAERLNWNFVPLERKGTSLRDFNDKQRSAAIDLLKASLSDQGYEKANGIMGLENVLKAIENRPAADNYRDPLNYHFWIFG